ncbi:hypothetical protein A4G20_00405 [Pasteurellaceae bacterium RH1A]|nr:hypothetical protein A4G20_00405 [Pasteurellaceae bacterium RH1A]
MNQGFSKFSWALALFCLPSALWPLGLFVSAKFSDHPGLSPSQIDQFSIAFWIYPLVLLALAGILFKLHKTHRTLASGLLLASFCSFYLYAFYIFSQLYP